MQRRAMVQASINAARSPSFHRIFRKTRSYRKTNPADAPLLILTRTFPMCCRRRRGYDIADSFWRRRVRNSGRAVFVAAARARGARRAEPMRSALDGVVVKSVRNGSANAQANGQGFFHDEPADG